VSHDAVDVPAQGPGDHADRLGEAVVANDRAILDALVKSRGREANALARQDGWPVRGQIINTLGSNGVNPPAHTSEGDDQQIEYKARINTGVNDGDPLVYRSLMEYRSDLRCLGSWVRHFFGNRNDIGAVLKGRGDFIHRLADVGTCGWQDCVGSGVPKHGGQIIGHLHPKSGIESYRLADIQPSAGASSPIDPNQVDA
jgi:hypothetical protein